MLIVLCVLPHSVGLCLRWLCSFAMAQLPLADAKADLLLQADKHWDSIQASSAAICSCAPDQKIIQSFTTVDLRASGCAADQLARSDRQPGQSQPSHLTACSGVWQAVSGQQVLQGSAISLKLLFSKTVARFVGTEFPGLWSSDLASQVTTLQTDAVPKPATGWKSANLNKQSQ